MLSLTTVFYARTLEEVDVMFHDHIHLQTLYCVNGPGCAFFFFFNVDFLCFSNELVAV